MDIVVISPENADSREVGAMEGFFAAGLVRYHLRKPSWTSDALESWLVDLPRAWRHRIVLHQHRALVEKLGLGGAHDRDNEAVPAGRRFSRSCHDIDSLRRSLRDYQSIFLGPVFPSITKQGYRPPPDFPWTELKSMLGTRTAADGRVLAVGGVTAGGLGRCRDLGFDGAAVLGAVWSEQDPVAAFAAIRDTAEKLEAARHAA
jgi:thiamine-phosphate pyrophosphorylase